MVTSIKFLNSNPVYPGVEAFFFLVLYSLGFRVWGVGFTWGLWFT